MLPALAVLPQSTLGHPSAPNTSYAPPRPHFGTEPFARFGQWSTPISIARDGTIPRLARWLALHQDAVADADALWNECRVANPECFRTYRVVSLGRPSFFLPAGEVAFEAIENPTQIPDRPPQGVMMRHMEALDAFAAAKFYFLRPVFANEPSFRLCTVAELRREAYFDQFDAFRRARHLGWAYRTQRWLGQKRDRAKLAALRVLVRSIETIAWNLMPTSPNSLGIDPATRRRLRRDLERRLVRTDELELTRESRRLRVAIEELQRRITIDPVLAFEVPSRPGELWFEAHWYTGNDGRAYVHY